jgi:hypothetical protein
MNINKRKKEEEESFHVKEEKTLRFHFQNVMPTDLWVCQ